jgi:hypothetical protein
MKKNRSEPPRSGDEMRGNYDFSGGVRGKHAKRYLQSNARALPEDLSVLFPDSAAVERALRKLLAMEQEHKTP